MGRKAAFFLVVVLCATAMCYCKPSKPLPVIRVGYSPHDHHSPLYIAAADPVFFKTHGGIYLQEISAKREYTLFRNDAALARVVVDPISTGGKDLIRRLSEGHFDLSFGGIPAMLTFIDQAAPVRILAPLMSEGAGLVMAKVLPVANWQTFVDYVRMRKDPVRIGYKADVSVQELIFERALAEEGISFSATLDEPDTDIVLVNLFGAENLIPALEEGLLDGFVIMQPFLAMAEEKGAGRLVALLGDLPPKGRWQGLPCCAIAGNTKYVAAHRTEVEAFLTLVMRATDYIARDPATAARHVAGWIDSSEEVERRSLPTIYFSTKIDDRWQHGTDIWLGTMIERGTINSRLKEAFATGRHRELLYDLDLYVNASRNAN